MSSDYSINKQDLIDAGVGFLKQEDEYSDEILLLANFPNREYLREVGEDSEGNIMISCGGLFRNWLDNDFLYGTKIRFVKM